MSLILRTDLELQGHDPLLNQKKDKLVTTFSHDQVLNSRLLAQGDALISFFLSFFLSFLLPVKSK